MSLVSGPESELLHPLYAGVHDNPPWPLFLARLRAQTQADRVLLIIRPDDFSGPTSLFQSTAAGFGPIELDRFAQALSHPINALRPGRVYALDELRSLESTVVAARQGTALAALEIAHARIMRLRSGETNTWAVLLHHRTDFRAADSALLSALAPHLDSAVDTRRRLEALTARAAMAEQALALLGIDQAALDSSGRPVAVPAEGESVRAALRGARVAATLQSACSAVANRPSGTRILIRSGTDETGAPILVRPAPASPEGTLRPPQAIAVVRTDDREELAAGAQLLTEIHGLSPREAMLAQHLSRGTSLVEAGRAAGLTPESARNYSKRIYARTGTTGQADLVRLILTGLAPLA